MRKILLAILLTIGMLPAFAQQRPTRPETILTKDNPITVVIDGQTTTMQALIIDTSKISVYNLTRTQARNENVDPLQLHLTQRSPQQKLVRLPAILDKFAIPADKRSLRVCIDKVMIKQPEQILADLTYITKVELTNDKYPAFPEGFPDDEIVINIVTPRSKKIGL